MSVKVVSVKTDDVIVCAFRVRGNVRQAFVDALTDTMAAVITLPVRWEDRDFFPFKCFVNFLRIAYLRGDLVSPLGYASVARLSSANWGVVRGVPSPLVFIYPPDKNSKNIDIRWLVLLSILGRMFR